VRPLRKARLAGKTLQGSVIRTLWGPEWARLLFFTAGTKYCHDGGMAVPTITASACQGSKTAMMAFRAALGKAGLQQIRKGSMIRALFGPGWTRLPFRACDVPDEVRERVQP
jgi:hypothetical protein